MTDAEDLPLARRGVPVRGGRSPWGSCVQWAEGDKQVGAGAPTTREADIRDHSTGPARAGAGIGWLRNLANLLRPLAYLYWRVAEGKVLGVRAIAQDEQGRILLVEHTYGGGWWLPGGGVKARETVFEAVERELREEAGVTLARPPRLLSLHAHRESLADDRIAVCAARIGSVRPVVSREIRRVELFAPEALPWGAIDGGCARRLREFIEDRPPRARW